MFGGGTRGCQERNVLLIRVLQTGSSGTADLTPALVIPSRNSLMQPVKPTSKEPVASVIADYDIISCA
eukprot:1139722-Pelagomonas_calceolata.AAC.4